MFSSISFPPKVIELIARQKKALLKKCPEGVVFINNQDDITDLEADIYGPDKTPYENGVFRIKLE